MSTAGRIYTTWHRTATYHWYHVPFTIYYVPCTTYQHSTNSPSCARIFASPVRLFGSSPSALPASTGTPPAVLSATLLIYLNSVSLTCESLFAFYVFQTYRRLTFLSIQPIVRVARAFSLRQFANSAVRLPPFRPSALQDSSGLRITSSFSNPQESSR